METLNLQTLELTTVLRVAPENGSPSSADYNDSQRETLVDLASTQSFINDRVLPMVNALPITAGDGLEGRTIFSDTSDPQALFKNISTGDYLTIADSLRLLKGYIGTLQTQATAQAVQIGNLATRVNITAQNDVNAALQSFSVNLSTLTAQATQQAIDIAALNESFSSRFNVSDGASAFGIKIPPIDSLTYNYALFTETGWVQLGDTLILRPSVSGAMVNMFEAHSALESSASGALTKIDVYGQAYLGVLNAAPPDAFLDNKQAVFYLDESANELLVKVKYSNGVVKGATVATLT